MSGDVGKGFARRVTRLNLEKFAPLLRDRAKELAESSPSFSTIESVMARSLFYGSKVRVALPFTFPWGIVGTATATRVSGAEAVLVAEIPGPGRWSQASFSKEVFVKFFGAGSIDLIYMNAEGLLEHETVKPIIKKSSNYCYELKAATSLNYPSGNEGRPIGVFLRAGSKQFQYRVVMPSDPDHVLLEAFLVARWVGAVGRMRRVTIDLDTLLDICPTAQLPLAVRETSGS